MLAYLHAIANPDDEVSLKRILNVPRRGVGDTSVGRLDAWAAAHGVAFSEALAHGQEAGLTGKALTGTASFLALMSELRAMLAGDEESTGSSPCRSGRAASGRAGPHQLPRGAALSGGYPTGDRGAGRKRRGTAGGGHRGRHAGRLPDRGEPGGRHRRGGRGRLERHSDDSAHGEGPRVPRRLHDRLGGRGFPSPAFSGRARRARRGAPSLLRGGDPGQRASLHLVRVVPEPVGTRPSTTRPAGSWARSRTIWSGAAGHSSAPTAAVAKKPVTTWSRRPCAGAGPVCRSRGRGQRHSG